ncbi:MAG: phosphatidate cytidylyltransferase [Gammaproteobacteria bacterium]|nr:MAG: phosphatidate cytidylyltransferase [Gammaproteobacteria bacterium]
MKTRIVSALALIPAVLALIIYSSVEVMAVVFAAITLLASWEWAQLSQIKSITQKGIYIAVQLLLLGGSWYLFFKADTPVISIAIKALLSLALSWTLTALIWMIIYSKRDGNADISALLKAIIGWFVLTISWVAIIKVREIGTEHLIILMFLIWGADSGAYFAGRFLGRHKLAVRLSPKKTIEGVIGGLITAIAIMVVARYLLPAITGKELEGSVVLQITLAVVVSIVSVSGDLFESMLKRLCGIKDSGNIIPGHGGILDRIDSLIAASPIYLAGGYMLGSGAL